MSIQINTVLNKYLLKFSFSATQMLVCISYKVVKNQNHYDKNTIIFAFHIFYLKCCLYPSVCIFKAVQDDISRKTWAKLVTFCLKKGIRVRTYRKYLVDKNHKRYGESAIFKDKSAKKILQKSVG